MAQFTNQARLSYNNTVVNSNVAVGEILEALAATKTAVIDTYSRGDNITYVISAVNSGTTPLNGLTLTDDLGGYTYDTQTLYPLSYVQGSLRVFVNGLLVPTPTVTAGPPLVINGLNIPAGGNIIVIYEAELTPFAPLDTVDSITNIATLSGAGIPTAVTVAETVTPAAEPELTITKSIEPVPVAENGVVTYTFVIQNYGNTPVVATDNASVSDLFDPVLTNLSVVFNGTVWTEGTEYTYDVTTGLFTTVQSQITVPAATYTRDPATGEVIITPGVSTLSVSGTI